MTFNFNPTFFPIWDARHSGAFPRKARPMSQLYRRVKNCVVNKTTFVFLCIYTKDCSTIWQNEYQMSLTPQQMHFKWKWQQNLEIVAMWTKILANYSKIVLSCSSVSLKYVFIL